MTKLTTKYLYQNTHDNIVIEFCEKCKKLNYVNNSSLDKMKWYWNQVQWVGTFFDDELVSISGIHKFPEINEDAFRVMFRGATLPGKSNKFLNFEQLPLKKEWAYLISENPQFYVTFNVDSKIGAKSSKMPRALKRLNKISYHSTIEYFNVQQEVYVLL